MSTFGLCRSGVAARLKRHMNKRPSPVAASRTLGATIPSTNALGWVASTAAGASYVVVLWRLVSPAGLPGTGDWPEALLIITMLAATLLAYSRHLPGQNVLMAAAVIGLIGSLAHGLSRMTTLPLGSIHFTERAGLEVLGVVPWCMPAIWIIAILNSRGVAKLILRPWRKLGIYGYWLAGVTAALTVLFAAGLEPFASQVKHNWTWETRGSSFTWHGAPLVSFLGWLITALVILALATPLLINKRPGTEQPPPDCHPLLIWQAALALFAIGAIAEGLWPAAAYCLVAMVGVAGAAVRGARWQSER